MQTPGSSLPSSSPFTRRWRPGRGFSLEQIEARPGFLSFRVGGRGAEGAFAHEAGGHRFQRVPASEKRGRVHSSTITVAVLNEPAQSALDIDPSALVWTTTIGSGAGGQNRNKTESAVVLVHRPTGLRVRIESERSQFRNKELALAVLRARLVDQRDRARRADRNGRRRQMVGSGERGDKRRTIAVQRDQVVDHVTGRSTTYRGYRRGRFPGLWVA